MTITPSDPTGTTPESAQFHLSPRECVEVATLSLLHYCQGDKSGADLRAALAIQTITKHERNQANNTDAMAQRLADALRDHLRVFVQSIVPLLPGSLSLDPSTDVARSLTATGIGGLDALESRLTTWPWAWDEALAKHVETLGPNGKKGSAKIRKASAEKRERCGPNYVAAWVESWILFSPPVRLQALAVSLWHDVVKPRIKDEGKRPQAIIRPVFTSQVMLAHMRPRIEATENQLALPGVHDGGLPCRVNIAHTEARLVARIRAGIDKLGTLTAHRVLRWEIETGHRQFIEGTKRPGVDFRKIEVEGGYSEIARRIGVTSGDDAQAIREIIAAQDATVFDFPWANLGAGHNGRLLIREEVGATRGRKAKVNLILGSMLVPGYASDLNKPVVSSASRKLVPVTDIPPLVGSPDKHGAQVSLSMMLVLRLRDHADELHQEGSIRLRSVDLQRMAREVGLDDDPGFLRTLWERWQTDGGKSADDTTPAFVKCDGDRFTLGDHHDAARQAILDAGAAEVAGRIRGQASQAKRASEQKKTLAGQGHK